MTYYVNEPHEAFLLKKLYGIQFEDPFRENKAISYSMLGFMEQEQIKLKLYVRKTTVEKLLKIKKSETNALKILGIFVYE